MTTVKGLIRPLVVGVIGLGAMLAAPGSAFGSDVDVSASGTLTVTDSAGVPRNTLVELGGGGNAYQVSEAGAAMTTPTAGACNLVAGGTAVRCPSAGVTTIVVDTGAGNDIVRIDATVLPAVKSILRGRAGDDILEGGRTRDRIDGGRGGDQMIGNQNRDTVTYAGIAKTITALIGGGFVSGSTLDGPAGSRDQVGFDIEVLIGGTKSNKLVGNGAANMLVGGPKQDRLKGQAGNDRVLGRGGRDYVIGGADNDRLVGGGDWDKIAGGLGIDKLFALDGHFDAPIDCGPGNNALESASYDVGVDPAPVNC